MIVVKWLILELNMHGDKKFIFYFYVISKIITNKLLY